MEGKRKQHLYLIRHAESLHNVYAEEHPHSPDPHLWDAAISEKGHTQVAGLKERVKVSVVVVGVGCCLTRKLLSCVGVICM